MLSVIFETISQGLDFTNASNCGRPGFTGSFWGGIEGCCPGSGANPVWVNHGGEAFCVGFNGLLGRYWSASREAIIARARGVFDSRRYCGPPREGREIVAGSAARAWGTDRVRMSLGIYTRARFE